MRTTCAGLYLHPSVYTIAGTNIHLNCTPVSITCMDPGHIPNIAAGNYSATNVLPGRV